VIHATRFGQARAREWWFVVVFVSRLSVDLTCRHPGLFKKDHLWAVAQVRNYRGEGEAESINADFETNKATPSPAPCQPLAS